MGQSESFIGRSWEVEQRRQPRMWGWLSRRNPKVYPGGAKISVVSQPEGKNQGWGGPEQGVGGWRLLVGGMFEVRSVSCWFVCLPQVVLDCPTDACFVYIYQYEPYLRDPVAYPKVQVRGQVGGEGHGPATGGDPLGLFEAGARNTSQTGRNTNGIYCPT